MSDPIETLEYVALDANANIVCAGSDFRRVWKAAREYATERGKQLRFCKRETRLTFQSIVYPDKD